MIDWMEHYGIGTLICGVVIAIFAVLLSGTMDDMKKGVERADQRAEWCAVECEDKDGWDRTTTRKLAFGGTREWLCWCNDHSSKVMP